MSSKYLCCGPKMPSYVRGRMSVWGQVGRSGENLGYRPSHIRVGTKVLAKTKNILTNPLRKKRLFTGDTQYLPQIVSRVDMRTIFFSKDL